MESAEVKPQVFILAAGAGERWRRSVSGGNPKQTMKLDGTTSIISRIEGQCISLGYTPIVVTNSDQIRECTGHSMQVSPQNDKFTVETLLSCESWFIHRNVVLLGDVVYSPQAIRKILTSQSSLKFFGSKDEIFGLIFEYSPELMDKLKAVWQVAEAGKCSGILWCLYRFLEGFGYQDYKFGSLYEFIEDGTDDIDEWVDFNRMRHAYQSLRVKWGEV